LEFKDRNKERERGTKIEEIEKQRHEIESQPVAVEGSLGVHKQNGDFFSRRRLQDENL